MAKMPPRWLNDVARLYAIGVGCLTLLSIGLFLGALLPFSFTGREAREIQWAVYSQLAVILTVGTPIWILVGFVLFGGCFAMNVEPPKLVVRCLVFGLFLALFECMGLPVVQMAR